MTVRTCAAFFFLIYGLLIPVAASSFLADNFVATLAAMACCFVVGALLWSGRAILLNVLIATYVFKNYLTRPYIDVFLPKLSSVQLDYISSINSYFNASDAAVVYLSLLSLLVAWLVGLFIARQRQIETVTPAWIFRQVDEIVRGASWQFWLVWALLWMLNFRSGTESWQGIATGQGVPLFAFGMFLTDTIDIVCLYAFLLSRQPGARITRWFLLVPVLVSAVSRSLSGDRNAVFVLVILASSYWIYLNFGKAIGRRDASRVVLLVLLLPVVIFSGLFAQSLRPQLKYGADAATVRETAAAGLDISNPNNPVVNSFYFGMTELLHRASALDAPFAILNDHFVHEPWDSYNPVSTLKRTINDLVPGDLFPNMLTIDQLFDYIYSGDIVNYSSMSWSIQGTLYLYFGVWLSPLVIFLVAYVVGQHSPKLVALAKTSPTFAAFFVLLLSELIENGTFERITVVDIVRPLTSFLAFVFLVRLLRATFPGKQRSTFALKTG